MKHFADIITFERCYISFDIFFTIVLTKLFGVLPVSAESLRRLSQQLRQMPKIETYTWIPR